MIISSEDDINSIIANGIDYGYNFIGIYRHAVCIDIHDRVSFIIFLNAYFKESKLMAVDYIDVVIKDNCHIDRENLIEKWSVLNFSNLIKDYIIYVTHNLEEAKDKFDKMKYL